jgi:hypothetical protein
MNFVDRGIGLSSNETRRINNLILATSATQPSQRNWLQKLELHPRSRVNHCCASRMSIVRLSRCLWRPVRFDAARLYRDPVSIYFNQGKLH